MPTHVLQGSNVAIFFMTKKWAQSLNSAIIVIICPKPSSTSSYMFWSLESSQTRRSIVKKIHVLYSKSNYFFHCVTLNHATLGPCHVPNISFQ